MDHCEKSVMKLKESSKERNERSWTALERISFLETLDFFLDLEDSLVAFFFGGIERVKNVRVLKGAG